MNELTGFWVDGRAGVRAEELTSSILVPIFEAALDTRECARLVELVDDARKGMDN